MSCEENRSLERHSLSLALRKQCKCTEAESKIRGKYVCVSFPREKHVSCVSFPARGKRKDNKGEGMDSDKKGKRKAYEKENHLMLAPFMESSEDLLLNYPSFFPVSSFTFPSTFI